MSRDNLDAWRRILAAYDRRDRSAFLAEMHHDVETIPLAEWPEPGPYVGEDVWNFHVAFADAWSEATPPRPTELLDFGDKVVACLKRTARGGESRISVTYRVYGVITFRDGKVARLQWFYEAGRGPRSRGTTGIGGLTPSFRKSREQRRLDDASRLLPWTRAVARGTTAAPRAKR